MTDIEEASGKSQISEESQIQRQLDQSSKQSKHFTYLNNMASSSSLSLPESIKLSSAKNYQSWTYAINEVADANLLKPHINPVFKRPKEVDPYAEGVVDAELERWQL
jgi:hypothetical protein